MTDERYTFVEDCREKKRTATGAFHKRTHAGKGGRVRFPSDYKTKKELRAMNGEVKSYKLNERMSWAEFKNMPDDLKKTYICGLRKSFGVPDKYIAEMFDVCQATIYKTFAELGLGLGKSSGHNRNWNKEAFEVWCNGGSWKTVEDDVDVEKEALEEACGHRVIEDAVPSNNYNPFVVPDELKTKLDRICSESVAPKDGHMNFDKCTIDQAFGVLSGILDGKKVGLNVSWHVWEE